jgi:CheY-specific phosphatase CheX
MTNAEIIDEVIQLAAVELLRAYGVAAQPTKVAVTPADFSCAAAVGFTGANMRGSLLIAVPSEISRRTCPLPSHAYRAWVAELSNQLLGRIKSKLLSYGVELHVTIPVVIPARLLTPCSTGPDLVAHRFTSEAGDVLVWFDYEAVAGLALVKVSDLEDYPEGTAVFW